MGQIFVELGRAQIHKFKMCPFTANEYRSLMLVVQV